MDGRRAVSPESALASDIFDKFCAANTFKGILNLYRALCSVVRAKPTHFPDFYPRLRAKLSSWRAQGLWSKFEKRASQKCYGRGKTCYGTRVLIIGAGPCGLRAAIEAQLLGAKVVVVEKRDRFSRNNVLHLWPFVITDLKALGAKKFYGKFCAGSIDHISIRQLQCILLKVALLLGVEVHEGVGFEGLRDPTENEGWRAFTSPLDHPVSHYTFDVLIGADGRRNTLEGFKRKALRAKLAIAITANFINKHTEAEARVKEISGVSYIFNQKFFNDLCGATGIDLENIVYYKDETHYFVMTAKKQSLLNKGVLLHDYADTAKLLSHENISSEALMVYALEAATFATDYQLPDIEFAVNHYGQPDVAMFDFTAMYAAENACRVIQKKGHKLLMTLVGDSLLEPFWPTGSGCARGFLSSFDASWMIRSWTSGLKSVLEVVAERESIYRLLGQTTPENLHKEHIAYTIDPHTRYPNLNLRLVMPFQVKSLYEADEKLPDIPDGVSEPTEIEKAPKKRRRDSVIAIDSLLTWLRGQVACYNLEVIDVRETFVHGEVLCAVIHRFRPDLLDYPLPSEENIDPLVTAAFRNQLAFDILHQEYGLSQVMSGFDSVQFGSSDFLTLVAYLSQVYEVFRGEIPQTKYSKSESGDELEENVPRSSDHLQALRELRVAVTAKHHFGHKSVGVGRRSRPSSGRESKESDSEPHRKHKKRRSDERTRASGSTGDIRGTCHTLSAKLVAKESRKMQYRICDVERFLKSMRLLQLNDPTCCVDEEEEKDEFRDVSLHLYRQTVPGFDERKKKLELQLIGRESRTVYGKSLTEAQDGEKVVPGLAKDLEAKFRGRTSATEKQKPKDLIRSIGKIEKSDWNVQLIEKKMAESKAAAITKKDGENKVPRWSREAYDDKRDAMKRKMDAATTSTSQQEASDETFRRLGNKLKHGSALDVGQRGCNKVSAMAEQLIHKLDKPVVAPEMPVSKQQAPRPTFELPKKGKVDLCHFCKERVYVVERMTAEGKFFHRNCFRCEYCNTSLRIGNYVFDREGRYGERFYCSPHYMTVRMYGWKKFDIGRSAEGNGKYPSEAIGTPTQQMLSEMDERGTTPERVEFENSVELASDDELLNEMDEDEWTDRNFGASNADNTSDEASDLSDDEEVTPEGNNNAQVAAPVKPEKEGTSVKRETESSDSDTEVASDDDEHVEEEEDSEGDEDEEEEDEYEEEECGGSTTEIETDSEFAEDPPNSVPGSIPTIVVNTPEQVVTKMVESGTLVHPKHVHSKEIKTNENKSTHNYKFKDLYINDVEPVKKGGTERQLPVVTPVPRRWEPLANNPDRIASKVSLELKKKYLQGSHIPPITTTKKPTDPAAQKQFRSVLDMISEQQKLLQPAPKHSAAMQAVLEGADKLKNKQPIVPIPLNRNLTSGYGQQDVKLSAIDPTDERSNGNLDLSKAGSVSITDVDKTLKDTTNLIISTLQDQSASPDELLFTEKDSLISETTADKEDVDFTASTYAETEEMKLSDDASRMMTSSDTPSFSTSETDTNNTVIDAQEHNPSAGLVTSETGHHHCGVESGSDTEVGSEPYSDLDDLDDEEAPKRITHEPPRVEIEDEFGVTKSLDPPPDTKAVPGSKGDEAQGVSKTLSSSDSSLNSGIFLETEMSEYVKEESVAAQKKRGGRSSGTARKSKKASSELKEDIPMNVKRESLGFDLEALDFADIDGCSSPDDFHVVNPLHHHSHKFAAPKCRPESQSPSITSPSEDDERSSTSTREQQSTSEAESESLANVNNSIPEVRFHNDIFTNPMMNRPDIALERFVPFSGVRDSLDYRKTRKSTGHLRNKDLYTNYVLPSSKGSDFVVNHAVSTTRFAGEIADPILESSQAPSSDESSRPLGSPATTRKLQEIHHEREKQNDLIRLMVLGRIKRSPEKTTRRNSKGSPPEASIQSDLGLERSGDETESRPSSEVSSQNQDGNFSGNVLRKDSSTDASSIQDIPHTQMLDSNSSGSEDSSGVSKSAKPAGCQSTYEPVFASSSPRFRNRTRNVGAQKESKTVPPTPTDIPSNSALTGSSIVVNGTSVSKQPSSNNAFYGSMPNLVNNQQKLVIFDQPSINDSSIMGPPSYQNPPPVMTTGMQKRDPFLISSHEASGMRPVNAAVSSDDFVNLHLSLRAKDPSSVSRRSPEKARSVYSDSRNFSDAGYTNANPSLTMSLHHTPMPGDEWERNVGRPRAHTVANLHSSNLENACEMDPAPKASTGGDFCTGTKSFSSDALIDSSSLSESGRRTSVPNIPVNNSKKGGKGKDRDRRRSLIQTVSDFFTSSKPTTNSVASSTEKSPSSPPGQSLSANSTSSSSTSPGKDKFSIFKLTPKLLQGRERKKSRESVVSPSASSVLQQQQDSSKSKTDLSHYLAQPELVVQRLASSPTNLYKGDRGVKELETCAQDMASLSILGGGHHLEKLDAERSKRAADRMREIEEIQLQLESIEADQGALVSRGIKIEKKLRGEEEDEDNRSDAEIMDEWFNLVREKTKLARFEKELLVRAQELDLEQRREDLEAQLETSMAIPDKGQRDKQRENEIIQELRLIDDQQNSLLDSIHADMEKYSEDPELPISGTSRLESDV